jgi:DNA polymerase I
MEKKLFLIDAYALIFRAYYAFIKNPRRTASGFNTSAIFGFTNTLLDVISNEKPSHIAVAFDPAGPNFRHDIYPQYKANRDETPEDIKTAVPYIKKIISACNIPIIIKEGFEADDIIGTLTIKAKQKGFFTYMMTPDKDFGQLVNDTTVMFKPKRNGVESEIWGVKEVNDNFGIDNPCQIIDLLALMGDASDNIPGAPGVGPKTASKLIKDFGSAEAVIENADKIKGSIKDKILDNIEKIRLSRTLATIKLDVPVDIDESDYALKPFNIDEIKVLFNELEFRTILDRVQKINQTILGSEKTDESNIRNTTAQTPKDISQLSLFDQMFGVEASQNETITDYNTIQSIEHNYTLVDTPEKKLKFIEELSEQKEFCFDTETTGLDTNMAELVGISFCWEKNVAYYIPIPSNTDDAKLILKEFEPIFSNQTTMKIGQNMKFDIQMLMSYGIKVAGALFDTMLAHYLINPEQKHNMDYLAMTYLNYRPVSIEELIGKKGKNQSSMRSVDQNRICEYACEDADITFQLKQALYEELKKNDLIGLFTDIETPLIPVLANMEKTGLTINTKDLAIFSEQLKTEINTLDKEIQQLAGISFNVASPKQLGEVLFNKLNISGNSRKTKSKQFATSEDVLIQLKDKHPIIEKILEYRSLAKLQSTYAEALPALINPKTGRIHTSFNQAVVSTGRLSSNNPNLQNIPIREEKGREIRKAFTASSQEHIFFSADYSQIELRLLAHLCEDQNLIDAFHKNIDIHTDTAARIYHVTTDSVTKEMRNKAKTANFGIIYGISAFGLAERLRISRQEAKELIDNYFTSYPGVQKYIEQSISIARKKTYVETLFGRRRYLSDINSNNAFVRSFAERNAINAPIQGTAADIIKIAMIRIHNCFEKYNIRSKMILQVHDELNFDVLKTEQMQVKEIVVNEMQQAATLKVPLIVESGFGNNWLEAH